ncbi:MAG: hypothetical protein H7068_05840 [Pedobacter sp.]|nr:hypothetical protein [Chitinophagaceae bacterium]
MKEVIKKYRLLIFIWGSINLFALFVNVFNVHPEFVTKTEAWDKVYHYYYFTRQPVAEEYIDKDEFYPSVTFNSHRYLANTDIYYFNGLFFHYDISEFLFYIGLLFMFLVYKSYISKPMTLDKQLMAK